jgi:predicted transposase YbfD/YdcC
VAEKSNEITEIPLLLRRLELTGALVAIDGKWHGNKYRFITRYRSDDPRSYDAMGTQREIAQTIMETRTMSWH